VAGGSVGTIRATPNPAASIPFLFPVCSDALKAEIRAAAEELDANRKARQAEHPDIARSFQQGRAVEKRVELTLSALARLGHLVSTDAARTFALRRTP